MVYLFSLYQPFFIPLLQVPLTTIFDKEWLTSVYQSGDLQIINIDIY
jgi:hypothetical protein